VIWNGSRWRIPMAIIAITRFAEAFGFRAQSPRAIPAIAATMILCIERDKPCPRRSLMISE
jgi:hypothetical protein